VGSLWGLKSGGYKIPLSFWALWSFHECMQVLHILNAYCFPASEHFPFHHSCIFTVYPSVDSQLKGFLKSDGKIVILRLSIRLFCPTKSAQEVPLNQICPHKRDNLCSLVWEPLLCPHCHKWQLVKLFSMYKQTVSLKSECRTVHIVKLSLLLSATSTDKLWHNRWNVSTICLKMKTQAARKEVQLNSDF
jgi:hypothetical protein